jgi:hypothetical protein
MTEQNEMQNTQGNEQVNNQQSVAQSETPVNQNVPAQESPVRPPEVAPQTLDLLSHQKEFVFEDKNHYKWRYTLQYPGIRKHLEMLDEAEMSNGTTANSILWEQYLKYVVVVPNNLTLDDFDKRPGLIQLMNACDSFLGETI